VFQFAYTSLFGFFAAFVFLRNKNILALILAHSFCNWMGLPRFWGRVGVEAGEPIGPPEGDKKHDTKDAQSSAHHLGGRRRDLGIIWTVAYYVILVLGAATFYYQLFPLTRSSKQLGIFE
jgi:prenyl protein peptidase